MAKKASNKKVEKTPYHVLADQHQALLAAGKHEEAAKFHAANVANYNGPAVIEEDDEELKKLEAAVDAAKVKASEASTDEAASAELAAAEKALADYLAE